MPHPEDTLDRLARLARDDEALHAASERRPTTDPSIEAAPASVLPESLTEPISEAQQSSFVDVIQARLTHAERARSPSPLALHAHRRRGALFALVALTATAAGVLLALRGSPDENGPLARYEVRLEGSEQTERASSTQVLDLLRLRPSSKLHFELRPKNDQRGSVRVRAFVQGVAATGSRETRELEVTQEQSSAGAVRVAAKVPTPLSERGELLLYVGRPAAIEQALPADLPGGASGPSAAQEFRWHFERAP